MRLLCLLALGSLCIASRSLASRSMALPPLRSSTIAGGTVSGSNCVSADVPPGTGNSGVVKAYQQYRISLRNLSNIQQTVSIAIERDTSISANYGMSIPDVTGPNMKMSSDASFSVTLQPAAATSGSSTSQVISMFCSKNNCWLGHPAGSVGTVEAMLSGTCGPFSNQVSCLSIDTLLNLRLVVAEDRGAVSGTVSVSAHRECGWKDHYTSPPTFIQINGGRAF